MPTPPPLPLRYQSSLTARNSALNVAEMNHQIHRFTFEVRSTQQGDVLYALEKFQTAVHTLATASEKIRDRLWYAWRDLCAVSSDDIPEHLRDSFGNLRRDITSLEPKSPKQDRASATISRVRIARCQEFAGRIVELADRLNAHVRSERTNTAVKGNLGDAGLRP